MEPVNFREKLRTKPKKESAKMPSLSALLDMGDHLVASSLLRHLPARSIAIFGGTCRAAWEATRDEALWEVSSVAP